MARMAVERYNVVRELIVGKTRREALDATFRIIIVTILATEMSEDELGCQLPLNRPG